MGNAAPTATDSGPAATLVSIELWFRPLVSAVASAVGGRHSFVVLKMSDGRHHLIEKHHDGSVDVLELDRDARVKLGVQHAKRASTGVTKDKVAFLCRGGSTEAVRSWSGIKAGVTLEMIKDRVIVKHEGYYDVHTANCHMLTQAIWNEVVMERKRLSGKPQAGLTWMASWIGVGASMRHDARTNGVGKVGV